MNSMLRSGNRLSAPIKEMLDVFIGQKFDPLKVSFIAERLKIDANTVIQRLIRDNNKTFESSDTKPKVVKVKPGIAAVAKFANRYKCRFCEQEKPEEELKVRLRWKNADKNNYNNLTTICTSCLEKNHENLTLNPHKLTEFEPVKGREPKLEVVRWDYKQLLIESREYVPPHDIHPLFKYYVYYDTEQFHHLKRQNLKNAKRSEIQWSYLAGEGEFPDNILSYSFVDIFQAFGNQGWELIDIKEINEENDVMSIYSTGKGHIAFFKHTIGGDIE
jgi:hypothetical protein